MCMGAGNRLQFKTVLVDGLYNRVRIVPRIDADRTLSFFTTEDAGMLLKSRNGDLFYEHNQNVLCTWYLVLRCLIKLGLDVKVRSTKYQPRLSKEYNSSSEFPRKSNATHTHS